MRGLLAIEPLYHQIVAGNKTQTRRSSGLDLINKNPDEWFLNTPFTLNKTMAIDNPKAIKNCQMFIKKYHFQQKPWDEKANTFIAIPRYKIGEVLYLKEPYVDRAGNWKYGYKFDFHANSDLRDKIKFKNKLFMPASAARAFIKITDIKCERLLEISKSDALAEGIEKDNNGFYTDYVWNKGFTDPTHSFITLYQKANKHTRLTPLINIWIWAYSFELVKSYQYEQK